MICDFDNCCNYSKDMPERCLIFPDIRFCILNGGTKPGTNLDYTLAKKLIPVVESALDIQEGGNHYKDMKIQPVEFIHANSIPFLEGNIIKYTCRYKNKNGIEDLKKVRHYVDLLIELEYGSNK